MTTARAYQQLKNVYHFFQARFWRLLYGRPNQGVKIYGVTGTNGKTTICILFGSILRAAQGKEKVGLLSTIVFWLGEEEVVNESKMTTLRSRDVFRYLKEMRQRGVTHVVMEVTSHALDQHRLSGVQLEGAIITNLAREHLDYHKTMEEYMRAKARILGYIKPEGAVVGKGDDEWVKKILDSAENTSKERSRAGEVKVVRFTSEESKTVTTPLPGDANQENVLAAAKLARAAGISEDAIQQGVGEVTHVPGRMEWVEAPQGFRVLIDYAVTPDALERLYQYVRGQTQGKIYGILGAAGLRDRGKRPDMARIVAQYADELVLTREDPWTEREEQIFQDLEKGLHAVTIPWQRITDRREALQYCIGKAQKGDVVVVTGKGAERGMGVGKKIIPWNEREVVVELLQ